MEPDTAFNSQVLLDRILDIAFWPRFGVSDSTSQVLAIDLMAPIL